MKGQFERGRLPGQARSGVSEKLAKSAPCAPQPNAAAPRTRRERGRAKATREGRAVSGAAGETARAGARTCCAALSTRRERRRAREAGVLGLDRHRLELLAVRLEELGEDGRGDGLVEVAEGPCKGHRGAEPSHAALRAAMRAVVAPWKPSEEQPTPLGLAALASPLSAALARRSSSSSSVT